MMDDLPAREDLIMESVMVFHKFTKALDKRNSGRAARGEDPLSFDPYHGQGLVLRALAEHDGISQARLAEMLEISPQTLSISLKKLIRIGLVEQSRSKDDGRVRNVRLTEEGFEAKRVLDERVKYSGSMFEALDDDELQEMNCMLSKLTKHLTLEIEMADISSWYLDRT